MIYILFISSLIIYIVLLKAKFKPIAIEKIIKGLRHFFIIFCSSALIFSIFQYWLDNTTSIDLAKSSILKIESAQHQIKDILKPFKMPAGYDILILILLIGLAGSFPFLQKFQITERYIKLNKFFKTILLTLTIFTTFTFFGQKFEKNEVNRIGELQIHKLELIKDNQLLLKSIEKDVTNKVINEILNLSEVSNSINQLKRVNEQNDSIKRSNFYLVFKNAATPTMVDALTINKIAYYDPPQDFDKAISRADDYLKTEEKSENIFYNQLYNNFKETNRKWFKEETLTTEFNKKSQDFFINIKATEPTKYSIFFSKYNEPYNKLIKKGWDVTGKNLFNEFLKSIGVDFPLMEEFFDPIINEPIQEFISEKTKSIFESVLNRKFEKAKSTWKNVGNEFSKKFGSNFLNNQKFLKFKNNIRMVYNRSKDILGITKLEIEKVNKDAELNLGNLKRKSRWEAIRTQFYDRLEFGEQIGRFRQDQLNIMKQMLKDWDDYLIDNKLAFYTNGIGDLETVFYNYIKNDPLRKVCWGFILQQQDWEGAVRYYTIIKPDPTATGKPYYLLNYYFNSTNHLDEIHNLYDNKTNLKIHTICPD